MTASNTSASPTATVSELLSALSRRLEPLIAARLSGELGGADSLPWTTVLAELDRAKGRSRHSYSRTDLQCQLRMLTERLGSLGYPFDDNLRQVSTVANELRIMRNRWAHNDLLSDLDAVRTADYSVRLLTLLGDTTGAAEAKTRRTGLLSAYATKTELTAPVPAPDPTPIASSSSSSSSIQAPIVATTTAPSPRPVTSSPTVGDTGRYEYEPWEIVITGGPEIIDALPKKDAKMQVRGVAAEIAEFEGPVSLDRLVTLTVRSFGMSRCGARKKQQVARQLRQLDLIIDADDFVWPTDIDPATWREFRPTGANHTAGRDFTDISPVEIANAWRIIAARQLAGADVPDAEIRRGVLNVFGISRAGAKVTEHLSRAKALL